MLARHHVAVAAGLSALGAAYCYRYGWGGVADVSTAAAAVAVGAGAGLAPDVDEPGSSAPNTLGWLGVAVAHLVRLVVRRHRGATHTVEVAAAVCALLWWVGASHPLVLPIAAGLAVAVGVDTIRGVSSPQALAVGAAVGWWVSATATPGAWWPAAAIGVGWLAHLLTDTPTPHGVPWTVWTLIFDWRYPSARLFRTGSWVEPLVAAALTGGLGYAAWRVSGLTAADLRALTAAPR